MSEKRRRGRPLTFSAADRQLFAELIRQHGIRGTLRIIETPISLPTLSTIAREFGISLRPGRRRCCGPSALAKFLRRPAPPKP